MTHCHALSFFRQSAAPCFLCFFICLYLLLACRHNLAQISLSVFTVSALSLSLSLSNSCSVTLLSLALLSNKCPASILSLFPPYFSCKSKVKTLPTLPLWCGSSLPPFDLSFPSALVFYRRRNMPQLVPRQTIILRNCDGVCFCQSVIIDDAQTTHRIQLGGSDRLAMTSQSLGTDRQPGRSKAVGARQTKIAAVSESLSGVQRNN